MSEESNDWCVWHIKNDEQAHEEIAKRIESIKKQHKEIIEIADSFNMRVNFVLESELIEGHNQVAEVYWSPSAQSC